MSVRTELLEADWLGGESVVPYTLGQIINSEDVKDALRAGCRVLSPTGDTFVVWKDKPHKVQGQDPRNWTPNMFGGWAYGPWIVVLLPDCRVIQEPKAKFAAGRKINQALDAGMVIRARSRHNLEDFWHKLENGKLYYQPPGNHRTLWIAMGIDHPSHGWSLVSYDWFTHEKGPGKP